MTIRAAKGALSIAWIVSGLVVVVILILRQLHGFYGAESQIVWGWVAQYVLPSLTLIAGAWTVSSTENESRPLENPIVFWMTLIMSLAYIGILFLILAASPGRDQTIGAIFEQSNLYLGLLQGIVIGLLGKFFVEVRG